MSNGRGRSGIARVTRRRAAVAQRMRERTQRSAEVTPESKVAARRREAARKNAKGVQLRIPREKLL